MLARNRATRRRFLPEGRSIPVGRRSGEWEYAALGENPAERQDGVSRPGGRSYKIEHRECVIRPCLHGAGSCGNTLIKNFEGLKRWSAPRAPVLILSISVRFQIGAHREFSLSYSNGLASIAKTCCEMLGCPMEIPILFRCCILETYPRHVKPRHNEWPLHLLESGKITLATAKGFLNCDVVR
jgi:hypothetical protein